MMISIIVEGIIIIMKLNKNRIIVIITMNGEIIVIIMNGEIIIIMMIMDGNNEINIYFLFLILIKSLIF